MPFLTRAHSIWLMVPALSLVLGVLVLPLAFLFQYSVLDGDVTMGTTGELTLQNYVEVLTSLYFLNVVGKTFLISAIVALVALVFGLPLAALMWRVSPFWRSPLTILVLSPLLVSMVASSYGWVVILGRNGVINSALMSLGIINEPLTLLYTNFSIGVGLVHIVLPFMVISILASLDRIEPALTEAAAILGANKAQIWLHLLLPLCIPGIGAGVTLVFALSISSYVTPAVLGPSGPNFVTTLIYQNFINLYQWGTGAAMALLLVLVALAAVAGLGTVISRLGPARRVGA